MTDPDFLQELDDYLDDKPRRFSPQSMGSMGPNVTPPGHCTCDDTAWCPLGRSGAKIRCNANELRDALSELQKVVVYLHGQT